MSNALSRFKKPKRQSTSFLLADDANALDAETVAAALGLAIERQGRHYELENGMRGTDRGHLVWCHKDGTGIGDNCALAQLVAGVPFRQALELLLVSVNLPAPKLARAPAIATVLRLPEGTVEHRTAGREYLVGRGVSAAALDVGEKCGMLMYSAGAVLFVGRDVEGKPRSATRRGYLPDDPTPKRDFSGTDKSWPAFISGQSSELWIVEGGADALAMLTMRPFNYPSILVSGGVHVTSWLDNPVVQQRLRNVDEVVVAGEWEKDAETQSRTDAQRQKLTERLRKLVPNVEVWMPREDHKDLAEMLSSVAPLDSLTNDREME